MPTDSFLLREVFSFCHEFTLILKSKWWDLNSRLGGCGIYVSEIYFSNFWKIKKKKKTEVTLSLILRFNLWLGGGATPYGARVLRAPYMIKISGLEYLTALKQTEVLEGLFDVSEGKTRSNRKDVLTTRSTQRRPAKYSTPAGLGYEELGGLSDSGQRDCS